MRTKPPEALSGMEKMGVLLGGINHPRPMGDQPVSDLHEQAEEFLISSSDGVRLSAWYKGWGDDAPLVILFHGYGAEKTGLLREARAFQDMGCSVMLVDFRGAGGSSAFYATLGHDESKDVEAAVAYARASRPHSKLILYGFSMGAASILKAVDNGMPQPEGVILAGVFDRMLTTVRNRFRSMGLPTWPSAELLVFWGGREFGFNGFKLNPADYAESLNCPALFMHGAGDVRTTLADMQKVYDAVPGQKDIHVFPDLGHESYIMLQPEDWKRSVSSFVGKEDV